MVDLARIRAEMAEIFRSAYPKGEAARIRTAPNRPRRKVGNAVAIGSAGLLGQIDHAASSLDLTPVAFGNYLMGAFGTDELAQLSQNDLRRVLRHLRLQLGERDDITPDRHDCPVCLVPIQH